MENEKKKSGVGSIILKVVLVFLLILAIAGAGLYFWLSKEYKEAQAQQTEQVSTIIGKEAPDYTVQLTDGSEIRISELLEDHEAVVVNIFATWCGPCEAEFPELEEFYGKYGDKVAVIAVDPDILDDLDAVTKYKESHALSFPMGVADKDSASILSVMSFPTTYVIDRNGKIGFYQRGAIYNPEMQEKVFTAFTGDDYQEKQVTLYTFVVGTKEGEIIPDAQLLLHSDNVEEIVTTDEDGAAYYCTENPEDIEVTVLSLPGNHTADDGVVARTSGNVSQWTVIYVD